MIAVALIRLLLPFILGMLAHAVWARYRARVEHAARLNADSTTRKRLLAGASANELLDELSKRSDEVSR